MKNRKDLKLFMVNDDLCSLMIYKEHLDNLGYKDISTFSNVTYCLEKLYEQPQLVLIDHDVDTLTGMVLLRMIKRANPDVHVVFVSGRKEVKTAMNLIKYGALDYISKDEHELENIRKVLTMVCEVKTA